MSENKGNFLYSTANYLIEQSCRSTLRLSCRVSVDIHRGAHIAMSEPFLDLLHWHALGEEYRGAGVAKIVEADLLQVMLLKFT